MSGNSEPDAAEAENAAPLSLKRIVWTMVIVVLIGAAAGFIFINARFGTGFLIGGILAFVNYYWLKSALKNVFEKSPEGVKSGTLTISYLLRYAALGAALWIIYLSGLISMIAVLLGMGAFALATLVEGLIIIFLSFSKREEF